MRPLLRLVLITAAALGALVSTLLAPALPAGAATAHATTQTNTKQFVVRPVHANGRPVKGYTVTKESFPGFTCDAASPVAVDPNIRTCGPSATYTVACWKSTHHTVLCLRNARSKQLVRIHYTGVFHRVSAPKHPMPQVLRLANRDVCLVRDGGAWGVVTGHPQWNGTYSCRHGDVYGLNDGIKESAHPWRVHVVTNPGSPQQQIVVRRVLRAWFVGTGA